MNLHNSSLDACLKQARVPERDPGYWAFFPQRVVRRLDEPRRPSHSVRSRWLPAAGLAGVFVLAGMFFLRPGPDRTDHAKLYREITAMFPNQVQAIIGDEHGVRVVLSERPSRTPDIPLLVVACKQAVRRFAITFSGQQIQLNGEPWDILLNGRGEVLVAGRSTSQYHIEAAPLRDAL